MDIIKAVVILEHDELESYVSDELDARYSTTGIPNWHENANYVVGDLVRFNGEVYRCKQPHISIENKIPTATQTLWAKTMTGV